MAKQVKIMKNIELPHMPKAPRIEELQARHNAFRHHPLRNLMVFGHMRSGSTLLAHLLFSHSEIAGFGETRIPYRTMEDLLALPAIVCDFNERPWLSEKFVVDKVLHNGYLHCEELLEREDVWAIFLIRRPEKSIPSILKTFAAVGREFTSRDARHYYIDRLRNLVRYATIMAESKRTFFITYEELIESRKALVELSDWMGLSSPLSETYSTNRLTGIAEVGDWGENIKSGNINRRAESIETTNEYEQEYAAYKQSCRQMKEICAAIEPDAGRV